MGIFYIFLLEFVIQTPFFGISSPYLYERGGLSVFFFLSHDYFVSHHYLASMAATACHLLHCHIYEISLLAPNIELIDDDTIVIESLQPTLCELRL